MEAACNRSVLRQEPAVATYFTPSSPRCFGKAGVNGRSGRSPGTGRGSGTSQHCHAESSGILRRGGIPPACDATTGRIVRGGGKGSGRRELRGRVRRFLRSSPKFRQWGGKPVSRKGFFAAGSDVQRRNQPVSGARRRLHLRRLVRREHPPASLCASLSRDLLDLSLRTFPTGGERAAPPPPNTTSISY